MSRIRSYIPGIITGYALYFVSFLLIIQLPYFHNIGADLNYSDIQEYSQIPNEEDCLPRQGETHFHNFSKSVRGFCFCGYIASHYTQDIDCLLTDFLKVDITIHLVWESEDHSSNIYKLPLLRAPPLA